MAKVELVSSERAPLLARPYYESGDPGPIAAALANVPELMDATLPFIGSIFGPLSIGPRLQEIVVLRVSAASRCRYCTETHSRTARRLGFDDEELAALRGEAPVPARWSPRERAAAAFSVALCERPAGSVDPLLPHFSEPEIVELVALGSATVMLNRFATALELPW